MLPLLPPLLLAATTAHTELAQLAPALAELVKRAESEPEALAAELAASPLAAIAPTVAAGTKGTKNATLPIVVAHGMGDSCFNPGMKSIATAAGTRLGVYSTCIPTASSRVGDTIAGFLKNMDASVEEFARRVRADPKLKNGFNAFGLSQGNNLIRGYIAKYNDPPVQSFISICGINAGVAAFPQCAPTVPIIGGICKALTEVLGDLAYNSLVQDILFQANYFRDPTKLHTAAYLKNSQLARWNGETTADMSSEKANWAKTKRFVWVEGTQDTVVYPREGEHWGALTDDYPKSLRVLPYTQTPWYANDTFGIKTADAAGKNFFESFKGQHIRFTDEELFGWLDKYFD